MRLDTKAEASEASSRDFRGGRSSSEISILDVFRRARPARSNNAAITGNYFWTNFLEENNSNCFLEFIVRTDSRILTMPELLPSLQRSLFRP